MTRRGNLETFGEKLARALGDRDRLYEAEKDASRKTGQELERERQQIVELSKEEIAREIAKRRTELQAKLISLSEEIESIGLIRYHGSQVDERQHQYSLLFSEFISVVGPEEAKKFRELYPEMPRASKEWQETLAIKDKWDFGNWKQNEYGEYEHVYKEDSGQRDTEES